MTNQPKVSNGLISKQPSRAAPRGPSGLLNAVSAVPHSEYYPHKKSEPTAFFGYHKHDQIINPNSGRPIDLKGGRENSKEASTKNEAEKRSERPSLVSSTIESSKKEDTNTILKESAAKDIAEKKLAETSDVRDNEAELSMDCPSEQKARKAEAADPLRNEDQSSGDTRPGEIRERTRKANTGNSDKSEAAKVETEVSKARNEVPVRACSDDGKEKDSNTKEQKDRDDNQTETDPQQENAQQGKSENASGGGDKDKAKDQEAHREDNPKDFNGDNLPTKSNDDSIGGPYMPRPVKQTRVAKRKKIVFTREQLMKFQSKCNAVPKGFPADLMKEIQIPEPASTPQLAQFSSLRASSSTSGATSSPASSSSAVASAAATSAAVTGPTPRPVAEPVKTVPQVAKFQTPEVVTHSRPTHRPTSSLAPVQPLAKSANRWQPSSARMSVFDKLMQKVTGILNKLAPEPGRHEGLFEKLYTLVKHHCRSTEDLVGICNRVFDKAVTEAGYAALYAKLCLELSKRCPTFRVEKRLPNGQKLSRVAEFKTIMLTKCQKEFQGQSKPIQTLQEKMNKATDPDIKSLLETKLKKRRQGNLRLIGELFKVGLEAKKMERVLHTCVQHLLRDIKNPAEEDIVCLEVLLNTAGMRMDVAKAQKYMNLYFSRISKMASTPNLAPRLKFKCKDLLELRARRWQMRRSEPVRPINVSGGTGSNQTPRPNVFRPQQKRPEPVALPRRIGNRYGAFGSAAANASSPEPTVVTQKPQMPQPKPPSIMKKRPSFSVAKKDVSFNLKTDSKSTEKLERDVISLVREYYNCGKGGLGEAALCIEDLKSPEHHYMVVQQAILLSLEKRERERKLSLELLVWLFVSKKMLTQDDFCKGLKLIFDELSEIQIDIPLAGKLVRAMCATFVKFKCISQESLQALAVQSSQAL